jgi:hypothetical protein
MPLCQRGFPRKIQFRHFLFCLFVVISQYSYSFLLFLQVLSVSISPLLVDVFNNALYITPSPINASQSCVVHFDGVYNILGDGSDYAPFVHRLG